MLAFNTLKNRYVITGTLQLDGAMHLGSGLGNERADALFARSNGQFYLPGSSVRGALRSTIEKLATGIETDPKLLPLISCFLDKQSGSLCVSVAEKAKNAVKDWREKNRLTDAQILMKLEQHNYLCRVCRLFGSPFFASKVKIADCFPTGPKKMPPDGTVRTGIGIDRDTGSVREGVLFEIEVLDDKPAFGFELIAENLEEPNDWGLLALGLAEMLRDPKLGQFHLGAKRAAGLGKCHLVSSSLHIQGFSGPQGLRDFISDGKYTDPPQNKKPEKFLHEKLTAYLQAPPNEAQVTTDAAKAKEN